MKIRKNKLANMIPAEKHFLYKVRTYAIDKPSELKTYVRIKQFGKCNEFYSELKVGAETYSRYDRDIFSIDPVYYAFDRNYRFALNWINIILYDHYLMTLTAPETLFIYKAESQIKKDMKTLESMDSFTSELGYFLVDQFRKWDFDDDEDYFKDPYYDEYYRFHRLLDCFNRYQFETRSLLTKDSTDKDKLFKKVKKCVLYSTYFDLSKEFKTFVKWAFNHKLYLLNEKDIQWVME